ncbi:MAG TPA: hypothetical protein PKA80_06235 [Ignavibacteriaceae bacterium]|nr:hypothetical protein [Ignavibacteriaceae bacterium]
MPANDGDIYTTQRNIYQACVSDYQLRGDIYRFSVVVFQGRVECSKSYFFDVVRLVGGNVKCFSHLIYSKAFS